MSERPSSTGAMRAEAWSAAAGHALAPLRTWWSGLAARERRLVGAAAAVVLVGLLWSVAVQPAWRTLSRAPAELDALDQQLQTMQRLAQEAQQLRATPPLPAAQAGSVLQAATARLGDQARLSLQGERAVLTLNGIPTSALRDWLAEARAGARARVVEASFGPAPGGGLSGTLVLSLGSGG